MSVFSKKTRKSYWFLQSVLVASLLIWFSLPARAAIPPYATNQNANAAVGQQNLTSSGINGTPGTGGAALSTPSDVWTDGVMLIVADTNNNRVLIFNSIPASNNAPADVVIGQPDAVSNVSNQGGAPAANTLSFPSGVFFDGSNLYIADRNNNRVLIYNSLPSANNASANIVVGQAGFGGSLANRGGLAGAATLSAPSAVYSDGTALYVADRDNNRVLIYNPIPAGNGLPANIVVGQIGFGGSSINQGGPIGAGTLSAPTDVTADLTLGKMFIADSGNNRVLIYNSTPTTNNPAANIVVGQAFMSSGTANQNGIIGAQTLSSPTGVFSDGTNLYVADTNNNRVLIYAPVPTANNISASFVLGQDTFGGNSVNKGAMSPGANTLSRPVAVHTDPSVGSLYVADQGNNRMLIFTPVPTSNSAPANVVVGQTNMTSGTPSQLATPPGANTLFRAGAVYSDRTRLFITDRFNNRVLIYNTIPSANGVSADVIVGQALVTAGSANQGGSTPGANTLSFPTGVFSDGTKLFIADRFNSRVLIYNAIPAFNNASANVVVGQVLMSSGSFNQSRPRAANTLALPTSVHSDGTKLYIADTNNNRVLIYNAVPVGNNAAANVVVGQPLMSSGTVNQGGSLPAANTLFGPQAVFSDGTKLFIADTNNNRVLIYNSIPAVNNSSASVVVGQADFSGSFANQRGPRAANTLSFPTGVFSDGTRLFITDSGNNRVLVYNVIPASNNASADFVLGQTTFSTGYSNQGASVAGNTLSFPAGVWVDSTTGRMFISDANNNRVLLDLPAISGPVGLGGGTVTLSPPLEPVQAQVQVPSGTFAQAVNLTLGALSTFPSAPSPAGVLKPSGVGIQINLDQPIQPSGNVTLMVTYNPIDLAALDISKLILARYDIGSNLWVPLPSISDASNSRVIAQTNHFSTFQIMQVDPALNSVSTVNVFPNPLMTSQGQSTMTFSLLPSNARIRIYNLSGVIIKDLSADNTGIARWDATNQAGMSVASGIYFAFAQANGQSRTFKVAIQR